MPTKTYSVFEYLYRDASNYKAWGKLLLSGQLQDEEINRMAKCFESREFFIAEQIGIPTLHQALWQYSDGPNSDDHVWHSFHSIKAATSEEITTYPEWGKADELFSKIISISSWNINAIY